MVQGVLETIHDAIWEDKYFWIVVHAPPRMGKTSLAMQIAHQTYKDWDKVLDCIVFNLPSLISKIETGSPCTWTTKNGLHKRVPFIIYDDFGVHSNKADTQHSTSWDIFKGGFDAIGTKLAILMATMVNADSATTQLQNKYNAELIVTSRGNFKFDLVNWQQDYRGFRNKMSKTYVEKGTFNPIPIEVYKKYDEMRQELVDEVFVRLKDAQSADSVDRLIKVVKPEDIAFLRLIKEIGVITATPEYKNIITRCRGRGLIVATSRSGNNPRYDLTQLACDLLLTIDSDDKAKEKIRRKGEWE
jgi:hypothetical protein